MFILFERETRLLKIFSHVRCKMVLYQSYGCFVTMLQVWPHGIDTQQCCYSLDHNTLVTETMGSQTLLLNVTIHRVNVNKCFFLPIFPPYLGAPTLIQLFRGMNINSGTPAENGDQISKASGKRMRIWQQSGGQGNNVKHLALSTQ